MNDRPTAGHLSSLFSNQNVGPPPLGTLRPPASRVMYNMPISPFLVVEIEKEM